VRRSQLGLTDSIGRDEDREGPRTVRPVRRDQIREGLFNASVMDCCSASQCICTCPDCGERFPGGYRCNSCLITHQETVEREQCESLRLAEWAELQVVSL
jgi:hypothetical protein